MPQDTAIQFAQYLSQTSAVKFGDFTLKSGKRSNVFFDFGEIAYGSELITLGAFFADFIVANALQDVDVIFGPAYKGINVASATSIALHQKHGLSIPFAYNRKVEKDHAEGGGFVGYDLSLARRALVIDDVITDGGAKYEAINMLSQFPQLAIKAFIVGVDRQEVDADGLLCLSKFSKASGLNVLAMTTKEDVLRFKR